MFDRSIEVILFLDREVTALHSSCALSLVIEIIFNVIVEMQCV